MARPTKYESWLKENPEGTPEQAFEAGIIDEKKYQELASPYAKEEPIAPAPVPTRIQPVITQQAIPHAKPITRKIVVTGMQDDKVYVKYMPTGKLIPMNRKQAEGVVKRSPKNYQIQS